MADTVTITRGAPAATGLADGVWRAGAARVDITPDFDGPMSGFGPFENGYARGFFGRLRANVLVLDDGRGGRVALIAADLHAGTRWLSERLGADLNDVGFDVSRVLLAGSHTHSGPGRIYGNPYFDNNTSSRGFPPSSPGFDQRTADHLARRVGSGVRVAVAALQPAHLGHGAAVADGFVRQRAPEPYAANPEVRAGLTPADLADGMSRQIPALADPSGLIELDPRIQVLWATRADDGAPIGGFATLGAHSTVAPRANRVWSGDAFAVAAAHARRELGVPIGLCGGAIGDTNLTLPIGLLQQLGQRLGRRNRGHGDSAARVHKQRFLKWRKPSQGPAYDSRPRPQHLEMTAVIGEALGERLVAACRNADARAVRPSSSSRIVCRFSDSAVAGASVRMQASERTAIDRAEHPADADVDVELSATANIGPPAARGSEGGRHLFSALFPQRSTRQNTAYPQRPKARGITNIDITSAPTLPVRVVRVGDFTLVGLPTEVTTIAALRLRRAIRAEVGPTTGVMVCSPAGDYAGYLTTAEEYDLQEYEGASTLWGRHTERWIRHNVLQLLNAAPAMEPEAELVVRGWGDHRKRQGKAAHQGSKHTLLEPPKQLDGGVLLFGRYGVQTGAGMGLPVPPDVPWIRLEVSARRNGPWVPMRLGGVEVSDLEFPVLVERRRHTGFNDAYRWCLELPEGAASRSWVRVVIAHPGNAEVVSGRRRLP